MREKLLSYLCDTKHIAVIESDSQWTYSDLHEYVKCFVGYFSEHKIKKILVILPQGFFSYAVILAAYIGGITFCPINSDTPYERMRYYVEIYKPDLVITNQIGIKEKLSVNCMNIEALVKHDQNMEFDLEQQPMDREKIAYVIFTSGSTGVPKGVPILRKALEQFILWSVQNYKLERNDRWGQFSNIGFDLSICDIFTTFSQGATLVSISKKSEKMYPALAIKNHMITVWHSVPSVIDLMEQAGHLNMNNLKSVHTYTFCGETLFASQVEKLLQMNDNIKIFNTYGPTETTIFCTTLELNKNNYKRYLRGTVSIGKAIPGWRVWIEQQEEDVPGELIIGGEYISPGYLGDESNKNFSIEVVNGVKINCFRTGDYVDVKDKNIYFIGRKDTQIKHMGFRIDLSELEVCARNFGCYMAKAVYIKGNIVLFVVCEGYSENYLRKYLAERLPNYFMPKIIINKENFSLNKSGKIDINKLKEEVDVYYEANM